MTANRTQRHYVCDGCHEECLTNEPEETALVEARALFAGEEVTRDNCGTLCDDCYQRFLTWYHSLTPEERAYRQTNDPPSSS